MTQIYVWPKNWQNLEDLFDLLFDIKEMRKDIISFNKLLRAEINIALIARISKVFSWIDGNSIASLSFCFTSVIPPMEFH